MKNSLTILLTLIAVSGLYAQPPQSTIDDFWSALVSGDTASLSAYYDDSVMIEANSELLKNKWSICNDSQEVIRQVTDTWQDTSVTGDIIAMDTTFADTVIIQSCAAMKVSKEDLMVALYALIQSYGTEWNTVLSAMPVDNMTQQVLSATSVKLSFPTGNADDALEFVFSTADAGTTWLISSELTDY